MNVYNVGSNVHSLPRYMPAAHNMTEYALRTISLTVKPTLTFEIAQASYLLTQFCCRHFTVCCPARWNTKRSCAEASPEVFWYVVNGSAQESLPENCPFSSLAVEKRHSVLQRMWDGLGDLQRSMLPLSYILHAQTLHISFWSECMRRWLRRPSTGRQYNQQLWRGWADTYIGVQSTAAGQHGTTAAGQHQHGNAAAGQPWKRRRRPNAFNIFQSTAHAKARDCVEAYRSLDLEGQDHLAQMSDLLTTVSEAAARPN